MADNLLDGSSSEELTIDEQKNYLDELVGEGKKFKSPEDLARGKAESDLYIRTLLRQKDELVADVTTLREKYNARESLEDLADQLRTQMTTSPPQNTPPGSEDSRPAFKPEELDSLVSNKIEQYNVQQKERNNFNTVQAKLKEIYGPNFANSLEKQINNLGLSIDDANALAKKSPSAFFKTFGLDEQKTGDGFQSPPRNQRSDTFAPATQKRTWSYYQNLKRTNPTEWSNPKTQVQMHEDYIRLGKEFEDGDFTAY